MLEMMQRPLVCLLPMMGISHQKGGKGKRSRIQMALAEAILTREDGFGFLVDQVLVHMEVLIGTFKRPAEVM